MSDEPTPDLQAARNGIVLLTILVEGGMVALALALGWAFEVLPLQRFALEARDVGWGLLATIPPVVGFAAMTRWPIGPLRKLEAFTNDVLRPFLAPCTTVDLLGISCMAGLGEEMLFRGFLQGALTDWLPWWLGLILTSVVFGLLHLITFTYAVLAALMGAYLGLLYEATGNLLTPMVTHAAYNFVVLVYVMYGPGSPIAEEKDEED